MDKRPEINATLLKILCCPVCKGQSELEADKECTKLTCSKCSKEFTLEKVSGPQSKGLVIPRLLPDRSD